MQDRTIRIGTRGSPLALAQAEEVRARLAKAHDLPEQSFEIVTIKTSGDVIVDKPLADVGGKGLFTKEIEEALLDGRVDLAVHSTKDMATVLPKGLNIGAILTREDVRDAFISLKYKTLGDLPEGARVGTSSLRRGAQVKALRPDLEIVPFRGNVQTRLRKLADGVADATFLACAGLIRLGLAENITSVVEVDDMLPAVAQGAISIEIRSHEVEIAQLVAAINDEATALCIEAERAYLAKLEGSCRTPIGGLAELSGGMLSLRGQILSPDGQRQFSATHKGRPAEAAKIGVEAADDLLQQAGPNFLNA